MGAVLFVRGNSFEEIANIFKEHARSPDTIQTRYQVRCSSTPHDSRVSSTLDLRIHSSIDACSPDPRNNSPLSQHQLLVASAASPRGHPSSMLQGQLSKVSPSLLLCQRPKGQYGRLAGAYDQRRGRQSPSAVEIIHSIRCAASKGR